jgi:hypothetical protein
VVLCSSGGVEHPLGGHGDGVGLDPDGSGFDAGQVDLGSVVDVQPDGHADERGLPEPRRQVKGGLGQLIGRLVEQAGRLLPLRS